jgi:hypothetical protein
MIQPTRIIVQPRLPRRMRKEVTPHFPMPVSSLLRPLSPLADPSKTPSPVQPQKKIPSS